MTKPLVLQYALAYLRTIPGAKLLPLHGISEAGACTCSKGAACTSAGKHPRTQNGVHDASDDAEQLARWVEQWPALNLGLTGDQHFVLDVDPRNGGGDSLERLIEEHGDLPHTIKAKTGGGGWHFFFRLPEGCKVPGKPQLGPGFTGLDIKGPRGYVVVAPSRHESGAEYKWEEDASPSRAALAEAPPWLLDSLRRAGDSRRTPTPAPDETEPPEASGTEAAPIPEGQRNNALASIGGTLRRVGGSEEEIETFLQSQNQRRCQPPLAPAEVAGITRSVSRYAVGETPSVKTERRSPKERLLEVVSPLITLFHTQSGEPYADVEEKGIRRTLRVGSSEFASWLEYQAHTHKLDLSSRTGGEAQASLAAKARYDGPTLEVFRRIAEHDGKVYLDLCNGAGEVVEVSEPGWAVVPASPVKFVRSGRMKQLPRPERGGVIADLYQFINANGEDTQVLFPAWLLGALMPNGPYPILILGGEQGSGKSSMTRIARGLIDPAEAEVQSFPTVEDDLLVSAKHNRVLAFDNLSKLSDAMSDALCRLSTGGGISGRKRYTDTEEYALEVKRPVILNGISDLCRRDDLRGECQEVCVRARKGSKRSGSHTSNSLSSSGQFGSTRFHFSDSRSAIA